MAENKGMSAKRIVEEGMGARVKACSPCKPHEFQDKTVGKGVRIWNPMVKDKRIKGYRCTVCGKQELVP